AAPRSRLVVFEQPQAVPALRDAKLELVPVVAGDEAELPEEVAQPLPRSFPHAYGVAAPTARELVEQCAQLVEARTEQRAEAIERIALGVRALSTAASGLVHGASTSGVGGDARASRPRRRR